MTEKKVVEGIVDEGGRHAYESGALREGKKSAPHMIATYGLRRVAAHYYAGGVKYKKFNMRQGLPYSSFVDSMQRHIWALLERDKSEDHLAAILWNALEYAWTEEMIKQGRMPATLDDLFVPPEVIAQMHEDLETTVGLEYLAKKREEGEVHIVLTRKPDTDPSPAPVELPVRWGAVVTYSGQHCMIGQEALRSPVQDFRGAPVQGFQACGGRLIRDTREEVEEAIAYLKDMYPEAVYEIVPITEVPC